jgi:hypothetical protein
VFSLLLSMVWIVLLNLLGYFVYHESQSCRGGGGSICVLVGSKGQNHSTQNNVKTTIAP